MRQNSFVLTDTLYSPLPIELSLVSEVSIRVEVGVFSPPCLEEVESS